MCRCVEQSSMNKCVLGCLEGGLTYSPSPIPGNCSDGTDSSLLVTGATYTLPAAAHLGLATGVLLAVLLNCHYGIIKRDRSRVCLMWHQVLITRHIFSLVCLLLATAAAPVALLLLGIFACYRSGVQVALKVMLGSRFAGLMDGVDAVWAMEDESSKSVVNVLCMLKVEDEQEVENLLLTLQQAIVTRFFAPANRCQKLMHFRRQSILGYFYWERQKELQIDRHVRWMPDGSRLENDGYFSEQTLSVVVSKIANTRLPADHAASWEVLVSHRPMAKCPSDSLQSMEEGDSCHKYPVLFRVHHAVGDGVALVQLMMKALTGDMPDIRGRSVIQRNCVFPDVGINSCSSSFPEIINSSKNTNNTKRKYDKFSGMPNTLIAKNDFSNLQLSNIQIKPANKMFTDQNLEKHFDASSTENSECNFLRSVKSKSKLCVAKPFQFQSNNVYRRSNIKIPCYAKDNYTCFDKTIIKSESMKRYRSNMVMYFQNSSLFTDSTMQDENIVINNEKTYKTKDILRFNTYETSDIPFTENYVTFSDPENDITLETNKYVSSKMQQNVYSKCQILDKNVTMEDSDESCFYLSSSSDSSSTNNFQKYREPYTETSSNLFSCSKFLSEYVPCGLKTKEINNSSMYCTDDIRPHSSDSESRPSSPISRPLTPTPYSLFQEIRVLSHASTISKTNKTFSSRYIHASSGTRSISTEDIRYNAVKRQVSSCNNLSKSEKSVIKSCLLPTIDKKTLQNSFSIFSTDKFLKNKKMLSSTKRTSPQKIKSRNHFEELFPPDKLKHINKVSKSLTKNCVSGFWNNKPHYSSFPKIRKNAAKDFKTSTGNSSHYTVVPIDLIGRWIYDKAMFFLNSNKMLKFTEPNMNKVKILIRENVLTKKNDNDDSKCFLKLFLTVKSAFKNINIFRILHSLVILIYAPSSFIQQMLMKASDKNCLHGPTLSGKKIITWYSDNSMLPTNKEYKLFNTIKRIKARVACEARFTDIFLAAVSSSLEMYFHGKGTDVPSSVNVILPLRMEPMPKELTGNIEGRSMANNTHASTNIINTPVDKFMNNMHSETGPTIIDLPVEIEAPETSNQFSVALMALPISQPSMCAFKDLVKSYSYEARLRAVCAQSELVRNSVDYRINYWLMKVVAALLPVPLLRPVLSSTQSTLVVSNVKGPSENIYIAGYKLGDMVFWVPNRGTTGLGISLLGYAGSLQLGLVADQTLVPTHHEANFILHSVVSELRRMDMAL
ncbi:uncharacterized protein LOC134527258 [Bacillus rossius redtenbacheri]|uniref:uncharacterized protein LOC134527258 n=1 Tax=Bacillus rossius redtenbacheri TaxID=93214 RepID=UPI002FDDE8F0